MATRLKNIVRFTELELGETRIPHLLNVDGYARTPDTVFPSVPGFEVTADDTGRGFGEGGF